MLEQSYWIKPSPEMGDSAVSFLRRFDCPSPCRKAVLQVTAAGVYDVYLNDNRVGDALLTPGCTSYDRRLQVQTYDITALLKTRNELIVTVGKGWLRSRMTWKRTELNGMPCALIAQIVLTQDQGTVVIPTDSTWQRAEPYSSLCRYFFAFRLLSYISSRSRHPSASPSSRSVG